MVRGLAAAILLAAAAGASAAPLQEPPAKAPPAPDAAPPRPPLDAETAKRLLRRAEENLRLHGLSFDARYLARALIDFRAVTSRLPEGADDDLRFRAWFGLGFTLARSDLEHVPPGFPDPAPEGRAALAEAAKLLPDFPGLPVASGLIRMQRGEPLESIADITAGLDGLASWKGLPPEVEREIRLLALLARAEAYLQAGGAREHLALADVQAASTLADEAARDPRMPPGNGLRRVVLTHLAAAYQRLDQFENAAKVLGWMTEDDPGNAIHAYHLGLVQANLQRFDLAIDCYRRAAHLDPADPRPHLKIAYILVKFGDREGVIDLDGALRAAEVYLSLRRGAVDGEYCALRAQVADLRQDRRTAETWARRALERDPLCRTALSILFKVLFNREDSEEPAVRRELDEIKKRLEESLRRNARGSDRTFC